MCTISIIHRVYVLVVLFAILSTQPCSEAFDDMSLHASNGSGHGCDRKYRIHFEIVRVGRLICVGIERLESGEYIQKGVADFGYPRAPVALPDTSELL